MEENYFNQNEMDEELTINLKKILYALWSRKILMLIVGVSIFLYCVLTTFTSSKIYTVDADLYINKTNNSNMAEINPYVIDETGGLAALAGPDKQMMNELELIQSPLVIDKVIKENNLKYKKLYGLITTKKTDQYISTEKFLKDKKLKIENKKNTNVVTISYKSTNRELAYNIVTSVITNYMELQKELNTEKSKSDKKILEAEYKQAKVKLNSKASSVSGLPSTSLSGMGSMAAMSAFSKSAQNALSKLQGQYVAGAKSQLEVQEETEKVAELSKKLEWAKLVDSMSDSSKVLVIKEPRMLKDYEQTSPKLFTNILLGIVFGILGALISCIVAESIDKKLCYSMLGDEIIYNLKKEFTKFCSMVFINRTKQICFIELEEIPVRIKEQFNSFKNVQLIHAEVSDVFVEKMEHFDKCVLFVKLAQTNAEDYKLIKKIIEDTKKEILTEVLL